MSSAPKLPAANEFTPGQLGGAHCLFELLALIRDLDGNRESVVEKVRATWFSASAQDRTDPQERLQQQRKRAQNVISGMRQYGLLTTTTDPLALTAIGSEILDHQSQPDAGYKLFVSFLLKEKRGIELLEVARMIRRRDGRVSKKAVDSELIVRGYVVSTNSSYSGKLRQWLEIANVVSDEWEVNDALLAELVGFSPEEIGTWRVLTAEQQSTIEMLRIRAQGNQTPIQSSELLELLRSGGVSFDGAQVRKKIYDPLRAGGWIVQEVASGGRGGKGGLVSLTSKSLDLDTELIKGLKLGNIPNELQEHLGRPTQEILDDLGATSTAVKGNALELLSLRLASDLGLLPVDLRIRSSQTGGAEVDLVAEGAHLHFSRWLFQCKNQNSAVGLSVLAKELGMATLLRAQVVVIVTTSTFASSVKDFARQAAETTSIQVILLDRRSLETYKTRGPVGLRAELHSLAVDTLSLKRDQLAELPRDL